MRLGDADEAVHDAPDGAEQADEGRHGADGGQNAHAAPDVLHGGGLDPLELPGHPLLDAVGGKAVRFLDLVVGHAEQAADCAILLPGLPDGIGQRAGGKNDRQRTAGLTSRVAQLDHLDQKHGPGCHRCQRKADHHGFDHDVGLEKHARGRHGVGQRADRGRPFRSRQRQRRRRRRRRSDRCRLDARCGSNRRGRIGRDVRIRGGYAGRTGSDGGCLRQTAATCRLFGANAERDKRNSDNQANLKAKP